MSDHLACGCGNTQEGVNFRSWSMYVCTYRRPCWCLLKGENTRHHRHVRPGFKIVYIAKKWNGVCLSDQDDQRDKTIRGQGVITMVTLPWMLMFLLETWQRLLIQIYLNSDIFWVETIRFYTWAFYILVIKENSPPSSKYFDNKLFMKRVLEMWGSQFKDVLSWNHSIPWYVFLYFCN